MVDQIIQSNAELPYLIEQEDLPKTIAHIFVKHKSLFQDVYPEFANSDGPSKSRTEVTTALRKRLMSLREGRTYTWHPYRK